MTVAVSAAAPAVSDASATSDEGAGRLVSEDDSGAPFRHTAGGWLACPAVAEAAASLPDPGAAAVVDALAALCGLGSLQSVCDATLTCLEPLDFSLVPATEALDAAAAAVFVEGVGGGGRLWSSAEAALLRAFLRPGALACLRVSPHVLAAAALSAAALEGVRVALGPLSLCLCCQQGSGKRRRGGSEGGGGGSSAPEPENPLWAAFAAAVAATASEETVAGTPARVISSSEAPDSLDPSLAGVGGDAGPPTAAAEAAPPPTTPAPAAAAEAALDIVVSEAAAGGEEAAVPPPTAARVAMPGGSLPPPVAAALEALASVLAWRARLAVGPGDALAEALAEAVALLPPSQSCALSTHA